MLYVGDSSRSHGKKRFPSRHRAFPIAKDTEVGEDNVLALIEGGVSNELYLDEFGNVWISSARDIEVFAQDGTTLGILHRPKPAANFLAGRKITVLATASTSFMQYLPPSAEHTASRAFFEVTMEREF